MDARNFTSMIVGIVVAVVVFSAVVIPIIDDSANETTDTALNNNSVTAECYMATSTATSIAITEDGTNYKIDGSVPSATKYITTDKAVFKVTSTTLTIYASTVTSYTATDASAVAVTITDDDYTVGSGTAVAYTKGTLMVSQATKPTTGTAYGVYSNKTVSVNESDKLWVLGSSAYAYGTANNLTKVGTITPTVTASTTYDDVSTVTSSDIIIAQTDYVHSVYELDETERTVLNILPIMMVIGILMAVVGMFVTKKTY